MDMNHVFTPNSMPNEGRVYFSLKGDFDPAQVTALLGITPTSAWARGTKGPVRDLPRCSLWDFSSEKRVGESVDIDALADAVVTELQPVADKIREAVAKFELSPVLQVVLKFSRDDTLPTPLIGFSKRTVQFVASVGAFIDIDTYRCD